MQISLFMDGEEHIHTYESIDGEVCDRCGGIMSETERKIRGLQNTVQVCLFFARIMNSWEQRFCADNDKKQMTQMSKEEEELC
jgi:hypothetical protein